MVNNMAKQYINDYNLQVAMTEYRDLYKGGDAVMPNNKCLGYVSQVYDNTSGDGEQIYAIVKDPSLSPEKVPEVTVLFRGSTGIDQLVNNPAEVWNDWGENDILLALRDKVKNHPNFTKNLDHSTGQLKVASKALNQLMKTYTNAKFNLYGHSLGAMNVQYAIANLSESNVQRIKQAYLYNGPDVYGLLNDKQKATVDSIKSRIHSYADPKDIVSMVGRNQSKGSIKSVGIVYYVDSKEQGMTDQHMTYGYQLDENGNIKTISDEREKVFNTTINQMEQYEIVKKKLSAGGYSTNERIFLDSEQAQTISSGLHKAAQIGYETIKEIQNQAHNKAEKLLASTRKVPFGFILSPNEVEEAYRQGGVTKTSIVDDVDTYFQPRTAKAKSLSDDFQALEMNIKNGIQKKLDHDKQLAGDFNQWTHMK